MTFHLDQILFLMDAEMEIVWQTDKPNGQPRRCVSRDKAKKEIGFEPTITLDEGLKQTIDWYQSNFA